MNAAETIASLTQHVLALTGDLEYRHCGTYDKAWRFIVRCFNSPESIVRVIALSYVRRCMPFVLRTAGNVKIKEMLCRSLVNIMVGDEIARNRTMSALCLSYALPLMHAHDFSPELLLYVCQLVKHTVHITFPVSADLTVNLHRYGRLSAAIDDVIQYRVGVLRCLGRLWEFSIVAQDKAFLAQVDLALTTLLHPEMHFAYTNAVLHCITEYMPVTRYNRLRVEQLYRSSVRRLIGDAGDKLSVQPGVKSSLSRFASTWYKVPADRHVLVTNPSEFQGQGYTFRRKLWLLKAATDSRNRSVSITPAARQVRVPIQHYSGTGWELFAAPPVDTTAASVTETLSPMKKTTTFTEEQDEPDADDGDLVLVDDGRVEPVSAETLFIAVALDGTIAFYRHPFVKEVHLTNRSASKDIAYSLQVYPPQYFSAEPAFGTVNRASTQKITVTFKRRPDLVSSSNMISGYIRVRDGYGFPVSRVSLHGLNIPNLRCSVEKLDFGCCAIGDSRIMNFVLQNVSSKECNLAVAVISKAAVPVFQVVPSQLVLMPNEPKTIKVKFSPTSDECLDDYIAVCSDVGEYRTILLAGESQSCVTVLDTRLNMGESDIHYLPVSKALYIRNNHSSLAVPVFFGTSSDEIRLVDIGDSLTLEPGQERRVQVDFLPTYAGARSEKLYIDAPFSAQMTVEVMVQVGPRLNIPVMEELFVGPIVGPGARKILVPVANLQAGPAQVIVLFGEDRDVLSLTLLDSKFANSEHVSADLMPFAQNGEIGYTLSMAAAGTTVLELSIKQSSTQSFRRTCLRFMSTTPRRHQLAEITLNSCTLLQTDLQSPQTHGMVQACLLGERHAGPPLNAPGTRDNMAPAIANNSTVFDVEPKTIVFHGVWDRTASTFVAESTFSLSNTTGERQNYRIALSKYLQVGVPLEGSVPAMSALDIPIQLDLSASPIPPDQWHNLYIGAVSVFDENATSAPGLATAAVEAVFGDHLHFCVRRSAMQFRLPTTRVLQRLSRKFLLQNPLPVEVAWQGTIHSSIAKQAASSARPGSSSANAAGSSPTRRRSIRPLSGSEVNAEANEQVKHAFQLTHLKQTLKPFATAYIEVTFQATGSGYIEGLLTHFYTDASRNEYPLESLRLTCEVGKHEVTVSSDLIMLEDMPVGEVYKTAVTLQNSQALASTARLFSPHGWLYFAPNTRQLAPSTLAEVELRFAPHRQMSGSSFVYVKSDEAGALIPVIFSGQQYKFCVFSLSYRPHKYARASIQGVAASLSSADVRLVAQLEPLDSEMRVGLVAIGRPRQYIIRLCNFSTTDVNLTHIDTGVPQIIAWDIIGDEYELYTPESEFGTESLEEREADWDEIDFRTVNIKGEGKPSSPDEKRFGKRSVRGTLTRRRQTLKQTLARFVPDSVLPRQIVPFHGVSIALTIAPREKGELHTTVRFNLSGRSGRQQSLAYTLLANAQPVVTFSEKRIDFGIQAMRSTTTMSGLLSNPGSLPVRWEIILHSSEQFETRNGDPRTGPGHCPALTVFPMSGTLFPESQEQIDVTFAPNLVNRHVRCKYIIRCQELVDIPLQIDGVGASAVVTASTDVVKFGTVRIGCSTSRTVQIRNSGNLTAKFWIDCKSGSFACTPEQGVLEGNGTVDLTVTFNPSHSTTVKSVLEITYGVDEHVTTLVFVRLVGAGGYPDIVVHTKEVDFGVALYNCDNVVPLDVENRGDADASLTFQCYHPAISLKGVDNKATTVPGHSIKQIHVVYRPMFIETLDVKLYVRSSDSRSDSFVVLVHGRVGVPKIAITPQDLWDNLDFGVCKVGESYTKELQLKNDGNIAIKYALALEEPEDSADERSSLFHLQTGPGTLEVGEATVVVVTFRPRDMQEASLSLSLSYNGYTTTAPVKGTGGQVRLALFPPIRSVDFGICRLKRHYSREVTFKNSGNYGVRFVAMFLDMDGNRLSETGDERGGGFVLATPLGFCDAMSNASVRVLFTPVAESTVRATLRVSYEDQYQDIMLVGQGAVSKLGVRGRSGQALHSGSVVEFGIHPVNQEATAVVRLVNEGPFGIDFFVQPLSVSEFGVKPAKGFLEVEESVALTVTFQPAEECPYETPLKILWEGAPIDLRMHGAGGMGKIEVRFCDQKDADLKGIDFGVVPLSTVIEKRLYLVNCGQVDVSVMVSMTDSDILMGVLPDPVEVDAKPSTAMSATARMVTHWTGRHGGIIPSMHAIELAVKYIAKSQHQSYAVLTIETGGEAASMEMKGRGGTILLSHKGDLQFGDIAVNHAYQRRLLLQNSGSIPSLMTLEWHVVGQPALSGGHVVQFKDSFSATDPRSGWARRYALRDKLDMQNYTVTARDHWAMVRAMVYKRPLYDVPDKVSALSPGMGGGGQSLGPHPLKQMLSESLTSFDQLKVSSSTLSSTGASSFMSAQRQTQQTVIHAKRRAAFFGLISSSAMTSQMAPRAPSVIKVEPASFLLPAYGDVELRIEVNLPTQDTYMATLSCKPNVANASTYEIAFTATPKFVSVIVDDSRILNFGRQNIGHREVLRRIFTNVGQKDFAFQLNHENKHLGIFPIRGNVKVGASVAVEFSFEPVDQAEYTHPIFFQPDCSQPVRLPFYAAGGRAKMTLSKYKRFDFGHCMIGKDTQSSLPIENEGDAILHLTRFELVPNESFFKGPEWPTQRVSVPPGDKYELPLIFNPPIENPAPGKLVVGTTSESFEIQLTGVGKEAVLIVSQMLIEFSDCLIGNMYTRKLELKNVGDVNYPVQFKVEGTVTGLEFVPQSLTVKPFSETTVDIVYRPTRETKTITTLNIASPYSSTVIPLSLHAGHAKLLLSTNQLDYGLFEKSAHPAQEFIIRNSGTINTAYSLKQSRKPALLQLTNARGAIPPGKEVVVSATFVSTEIGVFDEHIAIRTDLQNTQHKVRVTGQCEEAIVHPDEFSLINIGICPVLEVTSRSFDLKNYGKYPLRYQLKNVYPIKVSRAVGEIVGGETETITLSWNPSGGYELRTQMHIATNIGTFPVIVRGKAAFPDLALRKNYFDFGVCAVGHTYTDVLTLTNRGKVPLSWSIPTVRDCYNASPMHGSLAVKESADITVSFKPNAIGRFASNFIIECKGLNFKEVALIGVGGFMKLDMPSVLNLGQCPCDYALYKDIVLTNNGEVPLVLTFYDQAAAPPHPALHSPARTPHTAAAVSATPVSATPEDPAAPTPPTETSHESEPARRRSRQHRRLQQQQQQQQHQHGDQDTHTDPNNSSSGQAHAQDNDAEDVELLLPSELVHVPPQRSVRVPIGMRTQRIGRMQKGIAIHSKERSYSMTLHGTGVKIDLRSELLDGLKHEQIPATLVLDPLHLYVEREPLEVALERTRGQLVLDSLIADLLSKLMRHMAPASAPITLMSDGEASPASLEAWLKQQWLALPTLAEPLSFYDSLTKTQDFVARQKRDIFMALKDMEERPLLAPKPALGAEAAPEQPALASAEQATAAAPAIADAPRDPAAELEKQRGDVALLAAKFSYLKKCEHQHKLARETLQLSDKLITVDADGVPARPVPLSPPQDVGHITPDHVYEQQDALLFDILQYPVPRPQHVSFDTILERIEPVIVDDVSPLVRRPPPFPPASAAAAQHPGHSKGGRGRGGKSKVWEHEPTKATSLDRRQRNAKTVDFYSKGTHPSV
ncbi:hypothetical protein RI367_000328 [Sorochytrium milnesiophthora]